MKINNKLIHELVDRYLNDKPIFLVTYFVDRNDYAIKPIKLNRLMFDKNDNQYRFKGKFQSKRGKIYPVTFTPDFVDVIHALTITSKLGSSRILECITIDGDFDEIKEEMRTTYNDYDYSTIRRREKINPNPENEQVED